MKRPRKRASYRTFGWLTLGLIVVIGAALAVSANPQWHPYLIWIATLSIVTFFWYGFDKDQSRRASNRVPEVVLHVLALLGGFPGGWLGRLAYRHKTRKGLFTFVLIASTILHIALAPVFMAL
jgi:uncharacterized membrane protein YsdA (DUF1294 family)